MKEGSCSRPQGDRVVFGNVSSRYSAVWRQRQGLSSWDGTFWCWDGARTLGPVLPWGVMAVMLWAWWSVLLSSTFRISFLLLVFSSVTVTYLGVIYFVFILLGIAELLESVAWCLSSVLGNEGHFITYCFWPVHLPLSFWDSSYTCVGPFPLSCVSPLLFSVFFIGASILQVQRHLLSPASTNRGRTGWL